MRVCSVCGAEYGPDQKFCSNDGSPLGAAHPSDGLIGQVIADRYRVISTLGEGGMGRVYLAEHIRMRRQCAVKVISPALARTDAAVARFNREAENASQINHPNVVQVYDFGELPDHTLYLAMEFIEGETLTALMRREGPLSLRRAATITQQVADALSAAHHRGIVHRDLKPDNILVTRHFDGSTLVKVVDFGIAKTVQGENTDESGGGQTVTTAGVSVGTPEYMSPEQLAGERLDTRTDLYSLGLVFFNLLTADLPFPRVTSRENLIRRLMSPPRTLREVRPDQPWPASLQLVIDRALAADVNQRYASAKDFARELTALVATAPAEPEVTIPLRSASARSSAPTLTERIATAPITPDVVATPAAASAPSAAAKPKRGVGPTVLGFAATALVIASVFFFVNERSAPDRAKPAISGAIAAPVDSVAAIPDPHPESTVSQPTVDVQAPPVATRQTSAVVPPLRASDSGSGAAKALNTSVPVRLDVLQRDLDAKIALGRQYLIGGDVTKARVQFRQAVQEVTGVMTRLPNNPGAIRVRDSVARSLRGIVMQCQTALQRRMLKVTEPAFKCTSLVPGRFAGRRGGAP